MAKVTKKDPTDLNKKDLKLLTDLLEEQRMELIVHARETIASNKEDSGVTVLGDEVDQSTAEYEQAFEYRLRDREKFLLKKIRKALTRIEEGNYNLCESCDGPIGLARLQARPVATLCIECKEEQERDEKNYQKHRAYNADFEF
jgi:DnaK suppressor protein